MAKEICSSTEYFDDMYPEFAPDPIVVHCTKPATHLVGWEDDEDQWLCQEHYNQLSCGIGEGWLLKLAPINWKAPISWKAEI